MVLFNYLKEKSIYLINNAEKKAELYIIELIHLFFSHNLLRVSENDLKNLCFHGKLNSIDLFQPDKHIFKDETWERVVNRWDDRRRVFWGRRSISEDNACNNKKVLYRKNNMIIRSKSISDDWIYIMESRKIFDFKLEFNAVFYSDFKEIQFGFRHIDFYNRYRFRIENGFIHFDIVFRGKFFNSFVKEKFKPKLGLKYKFKLIVNKRSYCFFVNDKLLLAIKEKFPILKKGSYAIILWDPSKSSCIEADYLNINLFNYS
jgi:hypothetical protein